jgi:translation initiation factor 1
MPLPPSLPLSDDDLDVKRILKAFKKNFSCNGAVTTDEEIGEVGR